MLRNSKTKITSISENPSNWETVKLGKVAERLDLGKATIGTTPYIEVGDIDINSKKITIKEKGAVKGSIIAPMECVIVSRVRPTRGAVALIQKEVAISFAFTILKSLPNVNVKFLFHSLAWNKDFFNYLGLKQKGSTYPSVRSEDIYDFQISLPPLPEQRKIVYVLDSIQVLVGVQEKVIEKTKELKKALMNKLFREGTRGEELKETEIGEIPENWEVVRLGEITEGTEQISLKKKQEKKIKYIDVSSISNEYFQIIGFKEYLGKEAPSRARKLIKKDDIIFATVRPYLKRIAIIPELFDNEICSTAFCVIRCKRNTVNPFFVFNYLLINEFVNKVAKLQRGSGYPAVSDNDLLVQKIPLPPLPEQREIAEILSTIDQKIELEQKKKALYEELFRVMLNQLTTGKIRVRNL